MIDAKYIDVDGVSFIIVNEVEFNDSKYMLAIDEENEDTILVLKSYIKDGKEMVVSVVDDEEFEMVIELFKRKND